MTKAEQSVTGGEETQAGAGETRVTAVGVGIVIGNGGQATVVKHGIRADTIEAENVVNGPMVSSAALEYASALVKLARELGDGVIDARTIRARNVVVGLYVPEARTVDELHEEVVALRQQVQTALDAGEVADAADAEDIAAALATAEAELDKPQPSGSRVTRKLKEAAELLTGVAEAATAAGKMAQAVVKLAPVAMMVWKLAEALF